MVDQVVVGHSTRTQPIHEWDGNAYPNAVCLFNIQRTFIVIKE